MKVILCYGDSNTWGYVPGTDMRYSPHERWPGVLQKNLGSGYHVIEEGLRSRTTILDDPLKPYKNGKEYLIPCLDSHAPLDLVILMLGTNDLKNRFSMSAYDVAKNIAVLLNIATRSTCGVLGKAPKTLLLVPPHLGRLTNFAELFEGATEKSRELARYYKIAASEMGCEFLDTSEVIRSSDIDGVHLDGDQHLKLGELIANTVTKLFSDTEVNTKQQT